MEDWKEKVRKMRKNHASIANISKKVGVPIECIRSFYREEALKEKEKNNSFLDNYELPAHYVNDECRYNDSEENEKEKRVIYQNLNPESHKSKWSGDTKITFGLMGDTQFNSKYSQITYLHQYYDICKKRGIADVYHTGDIDDGEQMRMGHQYECYTQGADDHIDEIVRNYPMRPGITTHFITGNHDASIYKRCGVDIGRQLELKRPDMHYLGRDCAKVYLTPNCVLELRHPWDGTAYSLSYKPQKMIESFDPDTKPNILAIGHYHKIEYLFYRNIHCFQTGCFQMQTPFTRGKGISVHLGGWIVTIEVDQTGTIKKLVPEMIPFYKGIENDYKNWL